MLANDRLVGDIVTLPADVPVPESATVSGVVLALSVML